MQEEQTECNITSCDIYLYITVCLYDNTLVQGQQNMPSGKLTCVHSSLSNTSSLVGENVLFTAQQFRGSRCSADTVLLW